MSREGKVEKLYKPLKDPPFLHELEDVGMDGCRQNFCASVIQRCLFRKLRSAVVMTKIEKHLKRFNTVGFGEESTTSLPLFLSYECFNPGIKDLAGAKVVLVD